MEKLMYLVWLEPDTTRARWPRLMLGHGARRAAGVRSARSEHRRLGPRTATFRRPMPTPEGETPLHGLVSLWVDAVDYRQPYEDVLGRVATRVAGYQVVESLYRDYGDSQWAGAADLARRRALAGRTHRGPASSSIRT